MRKQFHPELSAAERIRRMTDNADKIKDDDYHAELTPEELDQKREEFTKVAIELNKIAERKKDVMDKFKEEMKPVQAQYSALLDTITIGKELRNGRLFDMANYDDSMMETYDENGEMVASRRLTPEEKRGTRTIPFNSRTGTND